MNYNEFPVIHEITRGFDIFHYAQLENICKNILVRGSKDDIEELIVYAFHTRDVCGKGEKSLGISMFTIIFKYRSELANVLIPLIPVYGCWKDMWKLYTNSESSREVIDYMVFTQFRQDQESEQPSLLAKYLPRENGARSQLAKHFADLLFAKTLDIQGQRMRIYRKTVASLNRLIDTAEIKMCGGSWSKINPGRVPGQLMRRNKNAFLNKRNSTDQDRIDCARNFELFTDKEYPPVKYTVDSSRYDKVREAMV